MKKIIIAIVIGLLIISLAGCSGNPDASKEVEAEVRDVITQFYKERRNSPVEYSIEIFKIKPLKEGFLAVAQQREEEGQPSLDLLLIQKKSGKYTVSKTGFGSIALSMGFSVNRVTHDNKTIIFGTLKDSTWIPATDKRRKVSYAEVTAVFNNGKSISEKIKGDKAYLLVVDDISDLKDLAFYNEKGQVEGTFKDLGMQIEDVDFRDTYNQQESRKDTINLAGTIDEKLDAIVIRNPMSSNPYDYIRGSRDYREIVNLGQPALEAMLNIFEAGMENGLREYIMAIACAEILGEKLEYKDWSSGREWYNKHMNKLGANIDQAAPQEVIRVLFWAVNNHKKDVYANCLSTRSRKLHLADNSVDPEFESIDYIRILDIQEKKATTTPEAYRVWGQGSITKPYDVKIFWVDYEVKYNMFIAQESGKHGWNYILIRERKNSPWKVEDWGY